MTSIVATAAAHAIALPPYVPPYTKPVAMTRQVVRTQHPTLGNAWPSYQRMQPQSMDTPAKTQLGRQMGALTRVPGAALSKAWLGAATPARG